MPRPSIVSAALFIFSLQAHPQSPGFKELFATTALSAPMPDAAFAPPATAAPPSQVFSGTLALDPPAGYGFGNIVFTSFDSVRSDLTWKQLPPFSITLVQDGRHLVPVEQGLILTGSLAWNLIVGPGAVWDQPGDGGYTRAALPFALIERSQNCVHNGELTFVFSNTQTPAVSQVRYQITQETCAYMKVDMWGQVPATYTQQPLPHSGALSQSGEIARQFEDELAHRLPRKPLSALATDFPAAHVDLSAFLRGRSHPNDVTTYGVYLNGVHYTAGCPTRYGEYAFCDEMRLPSYSTAKSAFTGVAMMRLGALFGPGVYTEKLTQYIPPPADKSWQSVTLGNALDMATGHFRSPGFERDEDGPEEKFLVDESLADKLADAWAFPAKVPPGLVWVYQSHNTFLAAVAMDAFLKQRRGPGADLFHLVADDIYKPLHLSQGMLSTLRTGNSESGVPEGYFGLFYIQDDVVKLARFLGEGSGTIEGHPLLDHQRLAESLFRTSAALGLPTGDPRQVLGTVRYNHAFWARQLTQLEYPQLRCDVWVPYMSGYGGITIAMLPGGAVFYVFSDAEEFVYNDALLETGKLTPLCPAPH